VVVFSAPGESRECVEIARRLRAEAERGVPFDRMAILLRAPRPYRTHLQEALRRASVPAYFARGAVRPDSAGRAFLALLACAAEGLSARRFAEYLSLDEVPDLPDSGQPPPSTPPGDRFVPPDEETVSHAVSRAAGEEANSQEDTKESVPTPRSSDRAVNPLGAPRHWEKILFDAAVIGGRDRWARRLQGWRNELELDRNAVRADDEALAGAIDRDIASLDSLRAFALPILDDLATLGPSAPWGVWIEQLTALATRALRNPARVLSVLAELAPMANVAPVDLGDVRHALEPRLSELIMPPTGRPAGKVFVASAEEARGLAFDVVFVPGLAEKMFPQKVQEDPILPDAVREALDARLRTNTDRSASERLALRLAVGAARVRLFLSYPRLDLEQSRPRTPSFYALEVLRASVGALPGFDELARSAESEGGARVGWPAPARSTDAIDEAEHDLALLDSVMRAPEESGVGTAHFLLNANVHLARALRFRGRRWNTRPWKSADGLVDPDPRARDALRAHALSARSYSPTALQHYASCPYRFVLQALHRLQPRDEPAPIEELDPLSKGSLVHEALFALFTRLRDDRLLPVTPDNLEAASTRLDEVLAKAEAHFKETLAPAIERVWNDEIERIKADLRELLRRASADPDWVLAHFELSFGLTDRRDKDPLSTDDPVTLDCGIRLRGSIDLVEQNVTTRRFRATDYKTGKVRAKEGAVIAGGKTLQPVMYALAIEKLLREPVEGGRLYYCTSTGSFTPIQILLDDAARESTTAVARAIGAALDEGFLPAAPDKGDCEWCDYRRVCGPHEERRTKRKDRKRLEPLIALRKRP
jgi:ATP-dependent helicase/nuclease subunit B